jgi:hypothetical protein
LETPKTPTMHTSRNRFLYFVPLGVLVLGFVLIAIDEANLFPWDQSHPASNVGFYLWTGGLFLILLGLIGCILGGLIALSLYLARKSAAKLSPQSTQSSDLSDQ